MSAHDCRQLYAVYAPFLKLEEAVPGGSIVEACDTKPARLSVILGTVVGRHGIPNQFTATGGVDQLWIRGKTANDLHTSERCALGGGE
jgi:hypothetical protein